MTKKNSSVVSVENKKQRKYRFRLDVRMEATIDRFTEDWRATKDDIEHHALHAIEEVFWGSGTTIWNRNANVTSVKEVVKVVEPREIEKDVKEE